MIFRRSIMIPAVLFLLPGIGQAGWVLLNSGITKSLHSVYFPVDAQTGYAVGDSGTCIKTTDGGSTWMPLLLGTALNLQCIHCLQSDTCYTVGETGTILKTTDGGTTWVSQTSGFTGRVNAVQFPINTMTGFVVGQVGQNGKALKTINGGAVWDSFPTRPPWGFYSVNFPLDNQTGYVAGGEDILKTTDGGISWFVSGHAIYVWFMSVHFPVDAQTGYAAGYDYWNVGGYVYKTTDGGTHWNGGLISSNALALNSVIFPRNVQTGYLAGYGDHFGLIYKTTDAGFTWEETSSRNQLYSIHFPLDAQTGYAVGDSGTILKTTDGGVGVEEKEGSGQKAIGSIKATPNPFTSFASVHGHSTEFFALYDVSGRRVGTYKGDRIGANLPAGVYFLRTLGKTSSPVRIVKVR